MKFYYHPDHLGSSSYITNLDGEVSQHIEYVSFGEVFIEERNNTWNTPYLFNFNAKEFDEGITMVQGTMSHVLACGWVLTLFQIMIREMMTIILMGNIMEVFITLLIYIHMSIVIKIPYYWLIILGNKQIVVYY